MEECDYGQVEKLIAGGDYQAAQAELDKANERDAKWHYFQSKVFFAKNWFNESKKQLEIAVELEPDNTQYKEELEKLNALGDEPPHSEEPEKHDMGKKSCCRGWCDEDCMQICAECSCYCICEGLCQAICEGCG